MARACLVLLSDATLRHELGHAARARILSMFTLEQSLAIFSDLYREVTGQMASAPVLDHARSHGVPQAADPVLVDADPRPGATDEAPPTVAA
jgi:hypothetical protein